MFKDKLKADLDKLSPSAKTKEKILTNLKTESGKGAKIHVFKQSSVVAAAVAVVVALGVFVIAYKPFDTKIQGDDPTTSVSQTITISTSKKKPTKEKTTSAVNTETEKKTTEKTTELTTQTISETKVLTKPTIIDPFSVISEDYGFSLPLNSVIVNFAKNYYGNEYNSDVWGYVAKIKLSEDGYNSLAQNFSSDKYYEDIFSNIGADYSAWWNTDSQYITHEKHLFDSAQLTENVMIKTVNRYAWLVVDENSEYYLYLETAVSKSGEYQLD